MTDQMIADFLAKGGKVQKIAPGVAALNFTARQWREQTQMTKADYLDKGVDLERQAERRHELAAQFAHVGDRQAAHDAAGGAFDL